MDLGCGCAPAATQEEIRRLDYWLKGGEVEGFPKHDLAPFCGYGKREHAVITMGDLSAYRHRNRLTQSEKVAESEVDNNGR